MQALILARVEMREFALDEECFFRTGDIGPFQQQGAGAGHRDPARTFAHAWKGENALGQQEPDAAVSRLLIELLVGLDSRRRGPWAFSEW
jgi:hypothetical protein